MLFSNNKELLKEIIDEISGTTKIAKEYIEKDFYAITVLKELIARNEKFIFKGGTSLSVCQKIIDRFSEDIDISYEDETITVGQRKKIKQEFFDSIESSSLVLTNADNIRSRRVFNRYLCEYNSIKNDSKGTVIVEWATQTPSFPIEIKEAQTIIGSYLNKIGRNDLIEQYDLKPFKVKTITKERTMVDKIFAICDYHISKKLYRQSRHIYDLLYLNKYVTLDNTFIDLFLKVKEYRVGLETCYSAKGGKVISSLLIDLINEKTYYEDFNQVTKPLLYDSTTYEECIKNIENIAMFLKNNNL